MRLENIKTIILSVLVIASLVLSYSIWTGGEQYEALPSWLTKPADISQIDDEDIIPVDIEDEKLVLSILAPERLIDHKSRNHQQYYLTSSDYSNTVWQKASNSLSSGSVASIKKIKAGTWSQIINRDSYEFIFAGSYPLEILFPAWLENSTDSRIIFERLLITQSDQPEVFIRSLVNNDFYQVNFESITWPEAGIRTFNSSNNDQGWRVYNAGYNNDQILDGVYLPVNFIANYSDLFPEVWFEAEIQSNKRWLPKFFTNPSLAREILLSSNKYYYTLGSTSLSINYNSVPHIEYSYTLLTDTDLASKSYAEAFTRSSVFIANHNYRNWPLFDTSVHLTKARAKGNNKYEFTYGCYMTDLTYNVPIESTLPAFVVDTESGVVTEMTRQVWEMSRHNLLPKIKIDATSAIERLSSDDWKVATEENPHAFDIVTSYQSYIDRGYEVCDVYLCYYTTQDLNVSIFISPHWAITLTNGKGSAVRFFINAMTEYIPAENGLIIE